MKIGATYPQTELQGDVASLDRFARQVEATGFDHLLLYDHVAGAAKVERDPPLWESGPYTDAHPFHEPLTAFAYVAAITQRIDLVTGILILPQRQTLLVAKQAAEVQILSGGRLQLGVGSGWNYVEYDALGEDFATRGKKMDEQIPYLRRLWQEPSFSFEGRFDRIDRASILPRPQQRIPIHCGGFTEPALRRAAKMADGFIFAVDIDPVLDSWVRLKQLLAEQDRPVEGFRAQYNVSKGGGIATSPEETVDILRRWEDAGGTHASIITMGRGYREVDEHLDHLETVRAKIGIGA